MTEFPADISYLESRRAREVAGDETRGEALLRGQPMRLLNRGLIAAVILNVGGYYASGTYEVIWSLFLEGLGADLALIGLTFAILMGGAVITEQVFNIPGIGRLLITAVTRRDYPVVQGIVLIIAGLYVVINLLVDILYAYLDPRLRLSRG